MPYSFIKAGGWRIFNELPFIKPAQTGHKTFLFDIETT
jgi:hypothetical protein